MRQYLTSVLKVGRWKNTSSQSFRLGWVAMVLMVAGAAMFRFGQVEGYLPLAGFTFLGACALFGAAYFRSSLQACLFPLLVMLISDVWLSQGMYASYATTTFLYHGWWWTYLSFLLMILWGRHILSVVRLWRVGLGGLGAALIHWIVSDIGPCIEAGTWAGLIYAKGWQAVMSCYVMGIPWSMRFLYATLAYSALLFGSFEMLRLYLSARPRKGLIEASERGDCLRGSAS